jgi:hypothetical protein
MQFTEADLQEFIRIWKVEFQESISLDEARHAASLLMELCTLLRMPAGASLPKSEGSLRD